MTTHMSREDVEVILERIQSHKGVMGLIIVSTDGLPVRSSMDNATTLQYVGMCKKLCGIARDVVRDADPQNELKILRVRTKKYEVMMAPENGEYLIVIQTGEQPLQPTMREILD